MEVLDAHLAHIQKVDGIPGAVGGDRDAEPGKVHAFITLTADRARAQAESVDRKIASGESAGPLAGVPVTIKDIFCVEGTPSTAASKILANFVAPYTATPVERWEKAGAVVLGKVNLDEFTYGSSNESSAFQPATRNPWDPSRVPGGSSGGSAAAVAAYEGPISLGTDTAGSIRLPAAYCGVVGLKPTYGRVSRYGLIAFGSSLDCPGPLTRSVADAALALGVMAGPDRHDSTAATTPVPDYLAEMEKGVKGLKIGLSPDYFRITYFNAGTGELVEQPVPAEIKQAVLDAAGRLAKMGAVREGAFSNDIALQASDFQALVSSRIRGVIPNTPAGNWYSTNLPSTTFRYINVTGTTQFRLHFLLGDDNDKRADYIRFYSGNAGAANRPKLIVEYYIP